MYLNRFEQRTLAWTLLEVAAPHLTDDDRTRLCVTIGAGDLESALLALVGRCMRSEVAIPADVHVTLRNWLRGYSGTEVAAAFEPYLGAVSIPGSASARAAYPGGTQDSCDRFGHRPRRIPVGSNSTDEFHRAPDAFAGQRA